MATDRGTRSQDANALPALQQLLAQRSAALAQATVAAEGQVDAEAAASLRALAELVGRLESAQPKPPRSRVPLIAALGIAAATVFMLSVVHVGETEVVMELGVSELSLRLATAQPLTPALSLVGLGVAGAQSIELPAALEAPLRAAAAEAAAALRIDRAGDDTHPGRIDLDPLRLPRGARVALSVVPVAGRFRLSLADAPTTFNVSVREPLRFTVAGQPPQVFDALVPKSVVVRTGTAGVDLELGVGMPPAAARSTGLASPIEIDGLSLQHIDPPRADDGRAAVRPVSTLRAGTLYFPALDSKERKLLPHELIGFEAVRGQVTALRLEPDQIGLRVQATVRGLALGDAENRRSLMPTWLEWLRERHGLSLFWGSALYLFGLLGGVLRWWRSPS